RAGLDDPAALEDDRAVGELDGREALRRDEDGAAGERRAKALDEPPLGERVHGREGVVEDDDPRSGRESARERRALALAAGEIDATLADQRLVALGQGRAEAVDPGGRRRRERLPSRRPRGRRGGSR